MAHARGDGRSGAHEAIVPPSLAIATSVSDARACIADPADARTRIKVQGAFRERCRPPVHRSIDLPPDARVVFASARLDGASLPPDGAAWFERPA